MNNKVNKLLVLSFCLLLNHSIVNDKNNVNVVNAATSLQSLIDNASSGQTILLNENSTSAVNVPVGKNIVIDLNGYEISKKITNNGTLKLIDSKDTGAFRLSSSANETLSAIDNYGDLTIDGVNIYCQGLGSETIANSITNKNGGKLKFLDGEIISTSSSTKWGFGINNEAGGIINYISGGSIKSHIANNYSASNAVTINNSGTIEKIDGGRLLAETNGNNGYSTAIRVNNGGVVNNINAGMLKAWANNSNGEAKGYGIYTVAGGTVKNITGGTIHGDSTAAQWAFGVWNQGTIENINGGNFVATIDHSKNAPNAIAIANDGKINSISGGTYYAYSTTPNGSTIGIRTRNSGSVLSSISGGAIYLNKENSSHYFLSEGGGVTTFADGYSLSSISDKTRYKYVLSSSQSYEESFDEASNQIIATIYDGSNVIKTYNLYGTSKIEAIIDGIEYSTIQEAVNNAKKNDVIVVKKDCNAQLTIPTNSSINIDLNSFTVSGSINNQGLLNIYNGHLNNTDSHVLTNYANATLNNVNITGVSKTNNAPVVLNTKGANINVIDSKIRQIAYTQTEATLKNEGIASIYADIECLDFANESGTMSGLLNTTDGIIESLIDSNIIAQTSSNTAAMNAVVNKGLIKNIENVNISIKGKSAVKETNLIGIINQNQINNILSCKIQITGSATSYDIENEGVIQVLKNSILNVDENKSLNIFNHNNATINLENCLLYSKSNQNILNDGTLNIKNSALKNTINNQLEGYDSILFNNTNYICDSSSIIVELIDDNNELVGFDIVKNNVVISSCHNYQKDGYYVEYYKDNNDKLIIHNKTNQIKSSTSLQVIYEKAPTYYFLGSSVTYGSNNNASSFINEIASTLNCYTEKEAISGTTLTNNGSTSYVARMMNNFDKNEKVESLIVQLSTNDVSQNKALGTISNSKNIESFDDKTVLGAIEFIIAYAKNTWDCDVIFYTNPNYNNAAYANLITKLYEIKSKWGIGIVDFYNYVDMDSLDSATLSSYMSDAIHPNHYGYEWMGKVFSTYLQKEFAKKHNNVLI